MKKKIVLSIILFLEMVACVLIIRYGIWFNNVDDAYELIKCRYSAEEIYKYDSYVVRGGGNTTLYSFAQRFHVECARKVSEDEGYVILLDENNKKWFFFFHTYYNGYGGEKRIYLVQQETFLSKEEVDRYLMESELWNPREITSCILPGSAPRERGIYVTEGLYTFSVDAGEVRFIPNSELRNSNVVSFGYPYILDIDRVG